MKDVALLILRTGISAMMIPHGYGKLIKIIEGNFAFINPIGLGESLSLFLVTFAEFVCPILIILGFKTRLAAIPVAFTMLVAALIQHHGDPISERESAIVYLVAFTAIAMLGAGKYSIDRK